MDEFKKKESGKSMRINTMKKTEKTKEIETEAKKKIKKQRDRIHRRNRRQKNKSQKEKKCTICELFYPPEEIAGDSCYLCNRHIVKNEPIKYRKDGRHYGKDKNNLRYEGARKQTHFKLL